MIEIIVYSLINLLLLIIVTAIEDDDNYVNTEYPFIFRKVLFYIPKRIRYFGLLAYVAGIIFLANTLTWIYAFYEKDTLLELNNKAVAILLIVGLSFVAIIETFIYRLINRKKYIVPKSESLSFSFFDRKTEMDIIEEFRYVGDENAKEMTIIIPWSHDISYEGNVEFSRRYEKVNYNYLFINNLVNSVVDKNNSALLIKYSNQSRLFTVEDVAKELARIIQNSFPDKNITVISHGPKGGVEALKLSQYIAVEKMKLLCGGYSVQEYYEYLLNDIIDNKMSSFVIDEKKRIQEKIAINNLNQDESECRHCSLIKAANTVENSCHGFCGKRVTPYFKSITSYSNQDILVMLKESNCPISIVWPEYSLSNWKEWLDKWENIENLEIHIVNNCYETFREKGLKERDRYIDRFRM